MKASTTMRAAAAVKAATKARLSAHRIASGDAAVIKATEGTGVAAKIMKDLVVDLKALRRELRGGPAGRLQVPEPRLEGIDLGAYRQRMLGDVDALTGRIRELEAERDRLRGILRRHGIEPDGGERSA